MLEGGDARAWAWFQDNCSSFDQEYGLTALAFRELEMSEGQRRLMKMKLREIYAFALKMQEAER